MPLVLHSKRVVDGEFFNEGWAVVGEQLGDPSTETIFQVYPLDARDNAKAKANELQEERAGGLSWLPLPVQLFKIDETDTGQIARYIEASDLVVPGIRQAAN